MFGEFKGVCDVCAFRLFKEIKNFATAWKNLRESEECKDPCIICFDLFDKSLIIDVIQKIINVILQANYDSDSFMLCFALPNMIVVRERIVFLTAKSRFPELKGKYEADIVVKKAFRNIITPVVAEAVKKTFKTDSGDAALLVNVVLDCKHEDSMPNPTGEFKRRGKKRNQCGLATVSKNNLLLYMDGVGDTEFAKSFPFPPEIPKARMFCSNVSMRGNSIFCGGRYNKWSRTLPQTAWIVDGVRKMDTSIAEIISNVLMKLFKAES